MPVVLDAIDKMSVSEKVSTMEYIWNAFADIRSLRNFAGIHPRQYGYFKMLMRRFPYAIYYEKAGTEVTVVAVLDCSRDPAWIVRRLTP